MRRHICFLLAFVLCLPIVAYAHPGRTDGSGGHTNRSTGEYHYHHGYSEHDHYDMDGDGDVDCPHDFRDETIYNESKDIQTKKSTQSLSDFLGKVFAFCGISGLILMFLAQFIGMFSTDIAASLLSIGFRILFLAILILIINLFLLFLT